MCFRGLSLFPPTDCFQCKKAKNWYRNLHFITQTEKSYYVNNFSFGVTNHILRLIRTFFFSFLVLFFATSVRMYSFRSHRPGAKPAKSKTHSFLQQEGHGFRSTGWLTEAFLCGVLVPAQVLSGFLPQSKDMQVVSVSCATVWWSVPCITPDPEFYNPSKWINGNSRKYSKTWNTSRF